MNREPSFEPKVQISAASYRDRLGLTNFINASYQIRDCLRFDPKCVLIIGGGVGLERAILRQFGIEVTVLDIDEALGPDVIGSVDDLSMFAAKQFDVVIASHVLEHLPFEYFGKSCREIARVGKHALIYLPFACVVPELTFMAQPLFKKTFRLRIPLFWKEHKFNGEHYWEIGTRGYPRSRIRNEIEKVFSIIDEYHNWDWRYSYNFVMSTVMHSNKAG